MTGSMACGHDAGYYTKGGESRDTYYTGTGAKSDVHEEPAGRWFSPEGGRNTLGLTGTITPEAMQRLYTEGLDPRDPRFWSEDPQERLLCARLGKPPRQYATKEQLIEERLSKIPHPTAEKIAEVEREVDGMTRTAVAFVDATYNPMKSVSVTWASFSRAANEARADGDTEKAEFYDGLRTDVEAACYEAHEEYINHLYDRAGYSREGGHRSGGAGRWERSEGWTVGQFLQYTSREGDPQLHVHGPILNKQVCHDGEARALDTALVMANKVGAGAIADRVLQQSITHRLAEKGIGVEWRTRPDGVSREIVGVDQDAMDLFSKRTVRMGPKLEKKIEQFRDTFGREPNRLEEYRLAKEASLGTRAAKAKYGNVSNAEALSKWDQELRGQVMRDLTSTADKLTSRGLDEVPVTEWSPSGVIAEALAELSEEKAAHSRTELEAKICRKLPDNFGHWHDPRVIRTVVNRLADLAEQHPNVVQVSGKEMTGDALPDDLRHADGKSTYVRPGSERWATQGSIVAEQALRRAAVTRGRAATDQASAQRWLAAKGGRLGSLHADQRAAIEGFLTKGAAVKVLIGPAGAGKSFTMGAIENAWKELVGGKVVGLALSENATNVLRDEGLTAKNIAQWLDTQDRLAEDGKVQGLSHSSQRVHRASAEDREWAIGPRDLVVIDEAAMVDRATVMRIHELVEKAGASMAATGDPKQTGAVGAGGAMGLIAESEGADVYTLSHVQRFGEENKWEGPASLGLRDGNVEAVDEYAHRGRLHDCGTVEQAEHDAVKAYVGDYLRGLEPGIVVRSNEQAAKVSSMVRGELIRLGKVGEEHEIELRDGTRAGEQDLIAARKNDWDQGVTNRRVYVREDVRDDGSVVLRATDGSGTRVVDKEYAEKHLTLAYASTATAIQGRTLTGGCNPIVDSGWSQEQLYMAMTRSKVQNDARVVTKPEIHDQPTGASHETVRQTAPEVVRGIVERGLQAEEAALVQAEAEQAQHQHSQTIHARHEDAVRAVCRARTESWLDELTAEGAMSHEDRERFAAEAQATGQLGRLLRTLEQAGRDPKEVLRSAIEGRSFEGLRSVAQGVQARIKSAHEDDLRPGVEHVGDSTPQAINAAYQRYVDRLGEMADDRRRELGSQAAEEQPQWAVEGLGAVPEDVVERAEWEHKAGIVGAYREAFPHQHTGDEVALGPAPGTSAPEARAAWHAAWTALGRPEAGKEESDLSDGALRNRVKAWEHEQSWAPPNVWKEMEATGAKAKAYREQAAVLRAEADLADNDEDRARLAGEADEKDSAAEVMDGIAKNLEVLNVERQGWQAETAVTEAMAYRAAEELDKRGKPFGSEEDRVTLDEWLEAERQSNEVEDPHRDITPDDAPDEVYDPVLDDLVAVGTVEQDEAGPAAAEERPAVDNVVDAELVEPEVVEKPVQDEQLELPVVDEDQGDEHVVAAELVEDEGRPEPEPAAVPADVVDAEVVEDDTPTVEKVDIDVQARAATAPVVEPAGPQAVEWGSKEEDELREARTVEWGSDEDFARSDPDLPAGVPSTSDVDTKLAEADLAAAEIADRRSAESARQQTEATDAAAAQAASRESAWRDHEAAQASRPAPATAGASAGGDGDGMS